VLYKESRHIVFKGQFRQPAAGGDNELLAAVVQSLSKARDRFLCIAGITCPDDQGFSVNPRGKVIIAVHQYKWALQGSNQSPEQVPADGRSPHAEYNYLIYVGIGGGNGEFGSLVPGLAALARKAAYLRPHAEFI
jgi:hypothetical protein